jgi:hypothetical protein
MFALLQDGKPHSRTELHTYCGPSSYGVVRFHIRQMRDKLINKETEAVVCVLINCAIHYQLVTLYKRPT